MKKKLSLNSFLGILKEEQKQSTESLEKLIFEEADASAKDANTELIESALNELLRSEGLQPGFVSSEVPFAVKPVFVDKVKESFLGWRIPKKLKRIASICCILILVCCANLITTYAFDFNLTEEFVSWTKNGIKVSVEESVDSQIDSAYDEIVAEMASCGNWNLLLPEYLPEECELLGYDVIRGDVCVLMSVFLESNSNNTLSLVSYNYPNSIVMKENSTVEIEGYFTEGIKKQVGRFTVCFVKGETENVAVFADNLSIYLLKSTYTQPQLEKIISCMR